MLIRNQCEKHDVREREGKRERGRRARERERERRARERELVCALSPLLTNKRQNTRKENRKQLNDKNNRKKVHTKALHSLLVMETVILAMWAVHVTNIATPKGKLGIVLLVKEELAQVYIKTTHIFVRFHLRGERVPNQ